MGRPDVRLGRPDIFHPRIVLAGCPQLVSGDGDDAELVAALRVRDLHARWLSWDDPETAQADLVILRATWDYPERLDEFLRWAGSMRNLLNPLPVVRWNTDKRYLNDLAAAGIPTAPSTFFAPDEPVVLPDGELVIKPAVAGGSRGAGRFTCPEAARDHAEALQDEGRTVLIQPYDPRVDVHGETSLVFLNGEPSHAFTKGALLPPPGAAAEVDESGLFHSERLAPVKPSSALWKFGASALAAAATKSGIAMAELLYARVDVIGGVHDDDPRLLELELVEPSLGWRQLETEERDLAQRKFVIGVDEALERLGLGPLGQHRRG